MEKRVYFRSNLFPYLLVAPQIVVTVVFFLWPAAQALKQSVFRENPFGGNTRYVGMQNFDRLFNDPLYLESFEITVVFSLSTTVLSMGTALLLALAADRIIKGATSYRTFLIWPYAVAPAVAGALWIFLFDPTIGILTYAMGLFGYDWNHKVNSDEAMVLVVIAAAWKQISYNFLFFVAGLQAIPKSLLEAAAIDGAGPLRRFWTVTFPLLSPTTFFLLVVNVVYAFFDTFGIIDAMTKGGPAGATNVLVYKVYKDGFEGLDLGGSAAQSVILMAIVIVLTVVQFRFIERKVSY